MIAAQRQSLLSSEISNIETRSEFMACMMRIAERFGLQHVSVLTVPSADDEFLAPHFLETTLPAQYIREFDSNRLLRCCPVLPQLSRSVMPQCWIVDGDGARDFDFPAAMLDLLRKYGLKVGLVFPLTSVDSSRYYFRYDGGRSPLRQAEINELGMITLQAFDRFDSIRRAEKACANLLSARELEVLRWTAQGKTSVEIGQILSLSDHTINAYMMNAIKKLDCVNRTHLVAKAIRLKLI
ncbi:LuxR C-terminal-related transcriptional regulator [Ciceribacter azotifigens]|uniref:helix-turn-helix transcriptional regulator n=1 Tax=Ciceribacter azotifigens TaxID=2069303 RepID=UPI003A89219C